MKMEYENMVNADLKITDPEKYQKNRKMATNYMRIWRKNNPEKVKAWSRKHYQKIKKDPIKYSKYKKQIADIQLKRYRSDPKFREKMLKTNRQYRRELRRKDPKKYNLIFNNYPRNMQPFVKGLKCQCGKKFITNVAGKSHKTVQCPECRMHWYKDELKKVKIRRNIPKIGDIYENKSK